MDLDLCFEGSVPAQITQVSLSSCSSACTNHNSLHCKLCPYHLHDLSTSLLFPAADGFFFLLKTTSDMVELLKEKQSLWEVEELLLCVCIVCLFFSTFPIHTTSSSEVSSLSSAQHT